MTTHALPAGSTMDLHEGLPVRVVDRFGTTVWRASWDNGRMRRATLRRPNGATLQLETDATEHPLFGRCDRVLDGTDQIARFTAVDWATPQLVPALDIPGAVPAGGGTAILNLLSTMATRANVPALHYRGPYPTPALFGTLLQSFRVQGPVAATQQAFCADAERLTLTATVETSAVAFEPAPHQWIWPTSEICVQLRGGIERLYVHGTAFGGPGIRTLRREGDRVEAWVEFVGVPWTRVGAVTALGDPIDGPFSLPPVDNGLVDAPVPGEVLEVLAAVLQARAPALLGPLIDQQLRNRGLRFADTGWDAARVGPRAIEIHAGLGARFEDLDPHRMLAILVECLEPIVYRLAQDQLAQEHARRLAAQGTPEA